MIDPNPELVAVRSPSACRIRLDVYSRLQASSGMPTIHRLDGFSVQIKETRVRLKLVMLAMVGIAVACPIAALAFVKPLRIAVPSVVPGIECHDRNICSDNAAELDNARRLYEQGIAAATAAVGPFDASPRIVFCSTDACTASFGLGRRAAEAVGNIGLVIAPRGWKPFYLTHELIHFRQAEALGNIAVATKPRWLIEGMAYSLSNDPRHPLGEPFEQWRSQFQAWYADLGKRDMWTVARSVK